MGNVASRPGDEGAPLYLRDQSRFTVASLSISNSKNRTILNITPNSFPATRYIPRRDIGDDAVIEYVQDPETSSSAVPPSFLLSLSSDDELTFNFTLTARQTQTTVFSPPGATNVLSTALLDTSILGLTFVFASSSKELENLVTREFHANPNLHKNPNVELLGDYSTSGSPSVQFHWSFKWRPPKPQEDKGGGWRTSCSFVEYDQRAHKLDTLAEFTFWVRNTYRTHGSPNVISPRLDVIAPPKLRVTSNQSDMSRTSEPDAVDISIPPPSPNTEAISEETLTLVPSDTNISANPSVKVDFALQRRDGDVVLDEGPVFRAKMKEFESRTSSMRQRWKKVLRKAEAALEAQSNCNDAVQQLTDALKEASTSNANAVQPAIDHYFNKIAKEISYFERQNILHLQKYILDPVNRLYNVDIKQAESKKEDFDRDTKDYYAYMSRYLGQRQDSLKEKKRLETDTKHQNKRRNYELKRFDYSSYMQDLHGGRKDQEVLSALTRYADAQTKGYLSAAKRIETMLPQIEALNFEVKEVDKDYQLQRTEREEKRRALEMRLAPAESDALGNQLHPIMSVSTNGGKVTEPDGSVRLVGGSPMSRMSVSEPASAISSSANSQLPIRRPSQGIGSSSNQSSLGIPGNSQNKFKGIRDLEERDYSIPPADPSIHSNRKEGLLWALSRPGSHVDPKGLNKQAWHKFWIVLDQGRLSEYSNWKEKLDLHMEPIDLRIATVREARNSERRFCLEIVTPKFTRVYQAQSEEDMRNWIAAINAANQTAFKRKEIVDPVAPDTSTSSKTRDIAAVLTGKTTSLSSHRSSLNAGSNIKSVSRNATVGHDKPYSRTRDPGTEIDTKLLDRIRMADEGNRTCADCNSEVDVEWASINIGIIVCIECSGIHRSLGTHITKMRSLTLDIAAFTLEIVELLLAIGNRVSNMIWESKLDPNLKPGPQSSREQRLRFITAKYVHKTYVQPISTTLSHYGTAEETLIASIKRNDLQQVLYALALGANRNTHDRSRNTHCVFLALAAADPASPSAATSPIPSPSRHGASGPTSAETRTAFVVAELLLQNGADLPTRPAPIPLSAHANLYLDEKTQQREGKASLGLQPVAPAGPNGDTLTALPNFAPGTGGSAAERAREREKLAKRGSTGTRVLMKTNHDDYNARRGL